MQEDAEEVTVQCTFERDYTIDDLIGILRVKRRQIFNYANTIFQVYHWEPETIFRPSHGRFSVRMLAEMRRLQTIGLEEYRLAVGRENHRPVAMKMESSALVVIEDCSVDLDCQISRLQQTAIAKSEGLADRVQAKLAEIARQNNLAIQQTEILDDAEILAAQNRGLEKALGIFQAEEQAKELTLASLRAMKLKGDKPCDRE